MFYPYPNNGGEVAMARPVSAKKVREILGSKKTLIIRKKQSSLDKTANLLADIIGEHLDTLPLDERKRRSANAHKFIQARKESYEKGSSRSKPAQRECTDPILVAARTR
jgi:hypothetical protein